MIDSWGIGFVLAERLPLGDLAEAIFNIVADKIETIFGDSITAIREDRIGVDVQFENGRPPRFDLIAGCDGLHSAVRELLWAPTTLGGDYSCGVWSCARRGSLL
jgi:2-polyprenyl-6-methoxyphenol hydroxylase-like FAD-dependent oxidoreductase